MAGFKRFMEMMDQEPEMEDRPHAEEVDTLKGNIVFNDVTFSYEGNKDVFKAFIYLSRKAKPSLLLDHLELVKQPFVH